MGQFLNQVNPGAWVLAGMISTQEAATMATLVYESIVVEYPIGTIIPYAGPLPTTSPPDILACDGSAYLNTDYPDLYSVIGTTWGAPDSTHFNVPDLRGRALIGAGMGSGLSNRVLGQELGEETHQLSVAELASHTHTEGTTVPEPVVVIPADGVAAVGASGVTGPTGGDQGHNNMQPSAVINWGIIAR